MIIFNNCNCRALQYWPIGQFWLVLYIIDPTFISFEEPSSYLSVQFSLFSLVTIGVVNLPEQTKMGLITGSDQSVHVLHSWFLPSLCIVESSILINCMNPFVILGVSGLLIMMPP